MKNKRIIIHTVLVALLICCVNAVSFCQEYAIKMRLKEGDVFRHSITMKMEITTMQTMNTTMNLEIGTMFKVLAPQPGAKNLQMTYTNMHSSTDISGMGESGKTDSLVNSLYSKMVDKPVILKLSADNQVDSVIGMDKLLINADTSAIFKQIAEKMFSKDQANNLFGTLFSMYPKQPVKIGETWSSNTEMNVNGLDMKVNLNYTLIEVKDGLATVNLTSTIAGNGQVQSNGMSFPMQMNGTQKGTLTINMSDGYMHSGDYTMSIDGNISAGGQEVPMSIKADYQLAGN